MAESTGSDLLSYLVSTTPGEAAAPAAAPAPAAPKAEGSDLLAHLMKTTPDPVSGGVADRAMDFVYNIEKGDVRNDAQRGRTVNGINKAANPDVDLDNLVDNPGATKTLYKARYWDAIGGDKLAARNPALAMVAFDSAINHGVARTQQFLKESGGDAGRLLQLRAQKYKELAAADPKRFGQYAEGWNNRLQQLARAAGTEHGDAADRAASTEPNPNIFSEQAGEPQGLTGHAVQGAKRGLEQSKGLMAGALALISNTVNDGQVNDFQRSMMGYYQARMEDAQKLQSPSTSFTEAAFGDGSLAKWAADSAGYLGYQIGEAVLTGGLGGALGKTVGKATVAEVATGMVEKEILRLAATETGKKLGKEALAQTAAANVSRNIAAGTTVFVNNLRQEGGSIYGEAVEQAGKTGEPVDVGRVWAAAVAAAGVDTAADVMAAKGVLGLKDGSTAPSYLGRAAREVPKGISVQSGTEGVQTIIERGGAKQEIFSPEGVRDIVDSMAVGALGGFGGGMASAVHARPADVVPPGLEKVAEKAAEGGTLSKAALAGAQNVAASASAQPQVDPVQRLAELERVAGSGAMFTAEEQAEYQELKSRKDATSQAAGTEQNAAAQADAKVQAEEAARNEQLTQRSAAIAAALRQKGALQKLRAEDSPVKVQSVLSDLAIAQSPSTDPGRREQALARLEYALEWTGINAPAPTSQYESPEAQQQRAQVAADKEAGNQEAVAKVPPQVDVDKTIAALKIEPALRSAEQVALVNMARSRYQPEDMALLDKAAKYGAGLSATEKVRIAQLRGTPGPALKVGRDTAAELAKAGTEHAPLPLSTTEAAAPLIPHTGGAQADASGNTEPAVRRKRRAQLRAVIDAGANRLERRGDGFYLTDGKDSLKLDGPGDAAMARVEIQASVDAAAARAKKDPSDAAVNAYNFSKGVPIKVGPGVYFLTETKKGDDRRSKPGAKKPWKTTMRHHYGDIQGTVGMDGDAVDAFWVGDGDKIFVIDQVNPETGKPDEHKVMLRAKDEWSARAAYLANYERGWKGLGAIREMTHEEFKQWVHDREATQKPASGAVLAHAAQAPQQATEGVDGRQAGSGSAAVPARGEAGGRDQQRGGVGDAGAGRAGVDGRVADGGLPGAPARSGGEGAPVPGEGVRADVAANEVGNGPDNPETGAPEKKAKKPRKPHLVTVDGKKVEVKEVPVESLGTDSPVRGGKRQRITRTNAKIIQAIAQAFGKDVVFFNNPEDDLGDGFVMPDISTTIFISENSSINHLAVFGHEMLHLMRREAPEDVYLKLVQMIGARLPAAGQARFFEYYNGLKKDSVADDTQLDARHWEELYADMGGTFLSDPTFWRELMDYVQAKHPAEAKSILAKIAAKLFAMIDHLVAYFAKQDHGGFSTVARTGLQDIEALRTAYKEALGDWMAANGVRKSAMRAQELKAEQEARKSKERDNALDEARPGTGSEPAAPGGADGDTPRYGQKREGSVSAVGIHYSQQPRKHLDAAHYGTGLKGAERERLSGPENSDIRPRIFFYVDKGQGVNPESGVGGAAHRVQLDNLYDVQKDPLKLVQKNPGANNWERAIMRAGFDGYLNMDPVMPQGYAVLVGKDNKAVPVKSTTAARFTAPAAPVEVEKKFESKAVDRNPELSAADLEKIPGSYLKYGFLTVPVSSREAANEEMERIGSDVRFSRAREAVIESPEFQEWFDGSKVTENGRPGGEPLVVYHGTNADFSAFDEEKLGSSTGHATAKLGFYFSADPDVAFTFTGGYVERGGREQWMPLPGGNLMPVFLDIKNPKTMSAEEFRDAVIAGGYDADSDVARTLVALRKPGILQKIFGKTYDGVHVLPDERASPGAEASADVWVAFYSEQVKSAVGNNGDFSKAVADITRSKARNVPQFEREPQVVDNEDSDAGGQTIFFDEYGEAYINFFLRGKRPHLTDIASANGVRGRDMMKWFVAKYGKPLVDDVVPAAVGFWEKMEAEGLIRSWSPVGIQRSKTRISDEDSRAMGELRRRLSVLDSIEKCLG